MSAKRGFQLIGEQDAPVETAPAPADVKDQTAQATAILMLALRALSQRFVVGLSNLFSLVTVGSVFWLWFATKAPDTHQLVSLGMYAVFILAVNYLTRRG